MFTRFCSLLFILVLGLFSSTGWALTINRGGTGTNNYLFIDNDVDREFLLRPRIPIPVLLGQIYGPGIVPDKQAWAIWDTQAGIMQIITSICG